MPVARRFRRVSDRRECFSASKEGEIGEKQVVKLTTLTTSSPFVTMTVHAYSGGGSSNKVLIFYSSPSTIYSRRRRSHKTVRCKGKKPLKYICQPCRQPANRESCGCFKHQRIPRITGKTYNINRFLLQFGNDLLSFT
jgi:hypothetical protein